MSEPTPNPDGKSFWTPRAMVAAAVVAVIVIAGVVLAVTNMITRTPDEPTPTSTITSPSATPDSGCPQLATQTGSATITDAPTTTWTLVGRMAAPAVEGTGPAVVDPDGWRHCYARTPTGALVAAANYIAMTDVTELHARLAQDGLMPSEARDRLMASPEPFNRSVDPMQIRGFRMVSFTADTAVVDLAVEMRGRTAAMTVTLHWYEGDWRLGVRGDETSQELDIDYSFPPSLYGYIAWAGA